MSSAELLAQLRAAELQLFDASPPRRAAGTTASVTLGAAGAGGRGATGNTPLGPPRPPRAQTQHRAASSNGSSLTDTSAQSARMGASRSASTPVPMPASASVPASGPSSAGSIRRAMRSGAHDMKRSMWSRSGRHTRFSMVGGIHHPDSIPGVGIDAKMQRSEQTLRAHKAAYASSSKASTAQGRTTGGVGQRSDPPARHRRQQPSSQQRNGYQQQHKLRQSQRSHPAAPALSPSAAGAASTGPASGTKYGTGRNAGRVVPTVRAELAPRRTSDPADGGVTTDTKPSPGQAQTQTQTTTQAPMHALAQVQAQLQAEARSRAQAEAQAAETKEQMRDLIGRWRHSTALALSSISKLEKSVASKDEEIRQLRQQLDTLRSSAAQAQAAAAAATAVAAAASGRQSRMEDESESRNQDGSDSGALGGESSAEEGDEIDLSALAGAGAGAGSGVRVGVGVGVGMRASGDSAVGWSAPSGAAPLTSGSMTGVPVALPRSQPQGQPTSVDEIAAQSWAEAEAEARAELGLGPAPVPAAAGPSDVLGSIPESGQSNQGLVPAGGADADAGSHTRALQRAMLEGVRDGSVDRFFRGLAADADQEARAGARAAVGAGAGATGDAQRRSDSQSIDEALRNRQREPRRKSPPPDTEAAAVAAAPLAQSAPLPRHARTDTLGGDAPGLENIAASGVEAAPAALSPRRKNSTWV